MLRRAMILPVVLVVIGLLSLVMAGFLFFVRAEVAGARAQQDATQARLAAESGLQELIIVLRESPEDPTAWWNVPERFRNALVWSPSFDRENDPVRKLGSRKEILEQISPPTAWRYSIVAPNLDGPTETFRYGITPEASKLNLNAASDEEIAALLLPLLGDLGLENAAELVACLLDWRDEDDEVRPGGAESEYYTRLEPGYYPKNGKLNTLDELLLVKGWTAATLYGEDTNRNGLLDLNENDGDASFPYYDNRDNKLDVGVAPYLTVWSHEPQQSGSAQGQGQAQVKEGLINVNTAPLRVLQVIMPAEVAAAVVAARAELSGEQLKDVQWVRAVIDPATYDQIKDKITTRALQFHVEILGYGDHTRLARRYEWIIEMRGALAQVLYHRDLTALGLAWPIDDDTLVLSAGTTER